MVNRVTSLPFDEHYAKDDYSKADNDGDTGDDGSNHS